MSDYNGLSSTAEPVNSYWKNVHKKELIYKISQLKKNQNQNVRISLCRFDWMITDWGSDFPSLLITNIKDNLIKYLIREPHSIS